VNYNDAARQIHMAVMTLQNATPSKRGSRDAFSRTTRLGASVKAVTTLAPRDAGAGLVDCPYRLGFLLDDVSRLRANYLQRALKSIRLTQSQFRVLVILSRVEHKGMIQTDLAHAMDLGKTTLGGLIDRLEVKSYVCRRPDLNDRRIKRITLTSTGRALISEIRGIVVEMNARIFRGFPAEVSQIENLLFEVKCRLVEMGARCK
jgi:MarR family transcriptional regulator, transcriptional regulator for hemolysin